MPFGADHRFTDCRPSNFREEEAARRRERMKSCRLEVQANIGGQVTGADPEYVGRPEGLLVSRFKDRYSLTTFSARKIGQACRSS